MGRHLFISQQMLFNWMDQGKIDFENNMMTIKADGRRFRLIEAVRFVQVEGEGQDNHQLLGRVKTVLQLKKMGAERIQDSVLFGELAYKVQEGFVGEILMKDDNTSYSVPTEARKVTEQSHEVLGTGQYPQTPQPDGKSTTFQGNKVPGTVLGNSSLGERTPIEKEAERKKKTTLPKEQISDEELLTRFLLHNLTTNNKK